MTPIQQALTEMRDALRVTLRRDASLYIANGRLDQLQTPHDWVAMRVEVERWIALIEKAGT